MRRYSFYERFGFLYCKYSPFVAKCESIEFYKKPPKNWPYVFEVMYTDLFTEERWDKTLMELHKMGIGDFNELVEYEGEPADYDIGTEKYHDLMNFDPYLLASIEWQQIIDQEIARLTPMEPVALIDPDWEEEEPEEPEGSWADLLRESYEYEEDHKDELPGSFGELMSTILHRY
jgi:hypothetical protein